MNNKPIYVSFREKKIENEFEVLKEGKFEDKQLFDFIERAIKDLKTNPTCGTKIPKKLWPKEYIRKFVNNLYYRDINSLFVFATEPDVDGTNNISERELRELVILKLNKKNVLQGLQQIINNRSSC